MSLNLDTNCINCKSVCQEQSPMDTHNLKLTIERGESEEFKRRSNKQRHDKKKGLGPFLFLSYSVIVLHSRLPSKKGIRFVVCSFQDWCNFKKMDDKYRNVSRMINGVNSN